MSTSGRRGTAVQAVHPEQKRHWLVRQNGRTLGPVTLLEVEAWIRSRCVSRTAELGLVGCDEWVPLHRALPFVEPGVMRPPPPPRRRPAPSSAASSPGRYFFSDDDEITQIRKVVPRPPGR